MSETSEKMIKEYFDRIGGSDADTSVREVAAGRLWITGDPVNQIAAEDIWKKVGTSSSIIKEMKEDYAPTLKNQLIGSLIYWFDKLKELKRT